MKNIIATIFVLGLISTSCESKFDINQFNYDTIEKPVITPTDGFSEATGKKGFDITTRTENVGWSSKLSSTKSHWFYSWGPIMPEELMPDNIEFVPMQWSRWGLDEQRVAYLKNLKEAGKIHYILGFNEPDSKNQANLTVDQAIALWPLLEEVGLPLGSPAAVSPTGPWMQEFMQKAEANNLRVDFITVHWYGGASASGFINNLKNIYNIYGKPIWITEFAPADWQATSPADNKWSTTQVLDFMKAVLPQLEELDFVKRYSWFPFGVNSAAGSSSAIFDDNGNLTPLGEYYANFKPNLNIGPGKD